MSSKSNNSGQPTKIFVSHANPKDNEFAAWLSSRLTALGYDVWVDLNEFVGGSPTWEEIQRVLQEDTRKVIYVLTPTSIKSDGVRKEISFATKVGKARDDKKFIVPIKLESVSATDINIELTDTFYLRFEGNWGAGLARLVDTLEKEKVPIRSNKKFDADFWTLARLRPTQKIITKPETYISNWHRATLDQIRYALVWLEPEIFRRWSPADAGPLATLIEKKDLLFFPTTKVSDGPPELPPNIPVKASTFVSLEGLNELKDREIAAILRNHFTEAVNKAWIDLNLQRGLALAILSRGSCPAFIRSTSPGRLISVGSGQNKLARALTGRAKTKFWHFGLEGRMISIGAFYLSVHPHIFFSADGEHLSEQGGLQGRLGASFSARRRWFNDEWRSLIELHMRWLAQDQPKLTLSAWDLLPIEINTASLTGEVPASYIDPYANKSGTDELLELNDEDDDVDDPAT